jgi:hypothetical protein
MGGLDIGTPAIRIITIILLVILLILYIYKWYKYYKAEQINVWPPNGTAVCPDYLSYNPNSTGKKCLNPFKLGGHSVQDGVQSTSELAEQSTYCTDANKLTWEGVC